MGIFDERIQKKNRLEEEMFLEAFQKLAGVVVGQKAENILESERLRMLSVMEELGNRLNISIPYTSNPEPTVEWYQEHYFRPQGIMWRSVALKENWYEDAAGVMLGFLKDGRPVALIPAWDRGCFYKDLDSGRRMRVTSALAEQFQEEAILYYRPLPMRKIDTKELWKFIRSSVSSGELLMLLAATVAALLLGMVTPVMTKVLTSNVTRFGDIRLLRVILVILLLVTAAGFLVTAMKQLLLARISSKVAIPLQAAFMMRILSAPAGELKAFSAGDLGTRIGSLYGSLKTLMNMLLSILLTAACSLICIPQMIYYAPAPALIAFAVTVVLVILYVLVIRMRVAVSKNRMTYHAEESGLTYALIDGMQKIILSGAEKRAFSVWARVYRNSVRSIYDPPLLLKVFGVLTPVVLLLGTMGI